LAVVFAAASGRGPLKQRLGGSESDGEGDDVLLVERSAVAHRRVAVLLVEVPCDVVQVVRPIHGGTTGSCCRDPKLSVVHGITGCLVAILVADVVAVDVGVSRPVVPVVGGLAVGV
jgi:hypothetical protein